MRLPFVNPIETGALQKAILGIDLFRLSIRTRPYTDSRCPKTEVGMNSPVENKSPLKRKSPVVWIALIAVPLMYALVRQSPWQWQRGLAFTLHWSLAAAAIAWSFRSIGGPEAIGLLRPGLVFVAFVATICAAVGIEIGLFHDEPLVRWQSQDILGLGRWSIAVVGISAGFCEELVYRGYMMTALKRDGRSAFVAMALSSLSFVFFHGLLPAPFLVAGFILSLIWAFIYHKTGILWVTVFIHGLWDVLILLTPWAAFFGE